MSVKRKQQWAEKYIEKVKDEKTAAGPSGVKSTFRQQFGVRCACRGTGAIIHRGRSNKKTGKLSTFALLNALPQKNRHLYQISAPTKVSLIWKATESKIPNTQMNSSQQVFQSLCQSAQCSRWENELTLKLTLSH
jgi:hypothetical protein